MDGIRIQTNKRLVVIQPSRVECSGGRAFIAVEAVEAVETVEAVEAVEDAVFELPFCVLFLLAKSRIETIFACADFQRLLAAVVESVEGGEVAEIAEFVAVVETTGAEIVRRNGFRPGHQGDAFNFLPQDNILQRGTQANQYK